MRRSARNRRRGGPGIAAITIRFGNDSGLDAASTRPGLILLASLLVAFLFIRTSARLMRSPKVPWWPGSVTTDGGLHVHHLVFGIVGMLGAGFALALQPPSPWLEIVAGLFGVGAGLTLDEYALWLHLEDVYWAEEGRRSMDAVVVAVLISGLVLLGLVPFSSGMSAPAVVVTVLLALAVSTVAVLKGKIFLGVGGMLFLPLGLVGALRLAKPDSPWARRRYAAGSRKLVRAHARLARHEHRYRRFQERIAGAPTTQAPGPTRPGGGRRSSE